MKIKIPKINRAGKYAAPKIRKPWETDSRTQLVQHAVIALAIVFFLLSMARIFLPQYRHHLAQDVQLEIVATGEKNRASLGNNIRLTRIVVNGIPRDLSNVSLSGNWQYTTSDDFLYVYNTPKPDTLTVSYRDVISMDLVFVSELGSGIAELRVNGRTWDRVDLYSDNRWSELTVRYDSSMLANPERHPALYLLVFCAVFLLFQAVRKNFRDETWMYIAGRSKDLLLQALLSAMVLLCVSILQYQTVEGLIGYFSMDYLIILESYLIVFLLSYLLFCIIQSHWLTFGIISLVLEILLIISNMKISARGTPLLPWDFQVASAALSVAKEYNLSIPFLSIAVLLCTVLIIYALFISRVPKRKYSIPGAVIGTIATVMVLLVYVQTTVFCGIWNYTSSERVYQVSNYYENNGFLVAFTEYLTYMLPPEPPEGYTEENMQQIAGEIMDDYAAENKTTASQPNVIVIMSESFWDVTRLENVTFEEEIFPVFNSLRSQGVSGDMLSHVLGGNTVISEFEFLTGYHSAFFPTDYMVYGSHLKDGLQSAVSVLSQQGYYTVAMHPYLATNYNRNTVYKKMGFDEMIFEDDFPKNAARIRNYISDDAMYQEIFKTYEQLQASSDQPLFLFGITMQNHGGYWDYNLHKPTQVRFQAKGYDQSTIDSMNDYFSGLHCSDAALRNLIDYFSDAQEEVIIIYFGDHVSDAGSKYEKMLERQSWYHSSTFQIDVRSHTVPYLIWSNRGLDSRQLPVMDIGQLLPTAMDLAGIPMPYFWHFVLDMKESYCAFNKALVVSADMSGAALSSLTPEQQKIMDTYMLLVYDYMWGENYARQLWQTP